MSKSSRPTAQKRAKEKARQEKQQQKEARRLQSKERKTDVGLRGGEEDPDIAGIRLGPQPLPPEWDSVAKSNEEKK
ncbi:MAG: hypothetical protein L0387_00135 [Acidobacteria bacterium]|nr:hypothetical protein [Acidobacteriota bacterium]MCI0620084.1 hypothetical protein [Acidobacteriota bacterium]MCI0720572.1 hypothetical protein [Acidobacteriota bacterium]